MARVRRIEIFHPSEVAAVHVMSRVVRRCFLMGDDPITGKNFDHRKRWIEKLLERFAASFGIDLIAFSLMSNHMHLVLRSRPDVVETWDDREVAIRWLRICPPSRSAHDNQKHVEAELNSICADTERVKEIRSRLSDISWWMRLLCQRISIRANAEEQIKGRFWEGRFKSVRLLDEEAILACAVYVDLNPIRAMYAQTIEQSDFTSGQRRIQALKQRASRGRAVKRQRIKGDLRDALLCPVKIDERRQSTLGPMPSRVAARCSDKGWTSLSEVEYLQLLDWTARQIAPGKRGVTPENVPQFLDRLRLNPKAWFVLVTHFSRLFGLIAGQPERVDEYRTKTRKQRFNLKSETRQLLA